MENQENIHDDIKQRNDNKKGIAIASLLVIMTTIFLIICVSSGFFGLLSTSVGNP